MIVAFISYLYSLYMYYGFSYIAVDMCEKWVKELIEKDVVKMTINEKGHVVMAKATPSVYEMNY